MFARFSKSALNRLKFALVMGPKRKSVNSTEDVKSKRKKNVSNEEKENNSNESPKTVLYGWCSTYPGFIPAMSSVSKQWNLKLVSWNVNGIRAVIKNGGMGYLKEEEPDILALQEVKCANHKLPSETKLSGYESFWSSAEKEGYAGTALYTKRKPISVNYGIGSSSHNKEGRVITAEFENFYFVTAYVPNAGQGLTRLTYRDKEWDPAFRKYLGNLEQKKPVILCGDLNVAHQEIDLANPDTNHKSAGFTDEERAGFTKLLNEVDLVDTYRHLYPDRTKAYTFWSYRKAARPANTGWRLDYFLVSRRILPSVCDHEIRCGISGSDHCPIVLYLNI